MYVIMMFVGRGVGVIKGNPVEEENSQHVRFIVSCGFTLQRMNMQQPQAT